MDIKKNYLLKNLQDLISHNSYIVVYQDNGLNANQYKELKEYLKQNNLNIIRSKNKLIRTALKINKPDLIHFGNLLEGPCLLAYSKEYNNFLYKINDQFPQLILMGGLYNNNRYISSQLCNTLKNIPNNNNYHLELINQLDCIVPFNSTLLDSAIFLTNYKK